MDRSQFAGEGGHGSAGHSTRYGPTPGERSTNTQSSDLRLATAVRAGAGIPRSLCYERMESALAL